MTLSIHGHRFSTIKVEFASCEHSGMPGWPEIIAADRERQWDKVTLVNIMPNNIEQYRQIAESMLHVGSVMLQELEDYLNRILDIALVGKATGDPLDLEVPPLPEDVA